MLRKSRVLFVLAAFAASLFAPMTAMAQTKPLCIGDSVVWENSRSKIYHAEGDPYFGKTKHGQYACKSAAEKDGYRLSKTTGGAAGGSKSTTLGTSKATTPVTAASSKPGFSLFGPRATATPAVPAGGTSSMASPPPGASPSARHRRKKSTAADASPAPAAAGLGTVTPAPVATGKHRRSRKSASAAAAGASPAPVATKKPRSRKAKAKASPSPS